MLALIQAPVPQESLSSGGGFCTDQAGEEMTLQAFLVQEPASKETLPRRTRAYHGGGFASSGLGGRVRRSEVTNISPRGGVMQGGTGRRVLVERPWG